MRAYICTTLNALAWAIPSLSPGGSSSVVVLGALQDSYQQFQYQLSAKLARWVVERHE
jgi:hypothetical protein